MIVALALGVLTGCTPSSPATRATSTAVTASAATQLEVPHGPTITAPAGAFSSDGHLNVAPVRRAGLTGWFIRLVGARLMEPVRLSFPMTTASRGVPSVMAYSEPPSTALHLVAGRVVHSRYVVTTDHFSDWWSDVTGYLHTKVLGWLVDNLGTVDVSTPACSGFDSLEKQGWKSRTVETKVTLECIGATSSGSAPQIKVANRLGIPLELETLPGLTVEPQTVSVDDQLGKLLTEASMNPFKPNAKAHFLAPGETAVMDGGTSTTGVLVTPSGVAILAGVLQTAVKALNLVDGWAGITENGEKALEVISNEGCLSGLENAAMDKSITNGTEAKQYLLGLVQPVFSCVASYVRDDGPRGLLVSKVSDLIEWLAGVANSGAQVTVGLLVSAYEPAGHEIDLIAPAAVAQPALGEAIVSSSGFGSAQPRTTWGGGNPTSAVESVSWSGWGQSTATGSGRSCWAGSGYTADCTMQPVTVFATALGVCDGKPAYQEYGWFFPGEGQTIADANVYPRSKICVHPSSPLGAVRPDSYRDTHYIGGSDYSDYHVLDWDSPDHEVRCSVGVNDGGHDPLPLECVAMHARWTAGCPHAGYCSSGAMLPGYSFGLGALGVATGTASDASGVRAHEAKVLPAGASITANGITCTAEADGMLCIADQAQGSFEMSDAGNSFVRTGAESYLQ